MNSMFTYLSTNHFLPLHTHTHTHTHTPHTHISHTVLDVGDAVGSEKLTQDYFPSLLSVMEEADVSQGISK
jgi:hypothetical protein